MFHLDVKCKETSSDDQQCSGGLEFKLNSSIGKQQPGVCLLVRKQASWYPGN
jgi:hypothetical protein